MRVEATDSAWRPLQVAGSQPLPEAMSAPAVQAPPGLVMPPHIGPQRQETPSFSELLQGALERVNAGQQQADLAIERVATGDAEDLHEAIIAVEQADLALRLTAQVTQRAVEAYKEISRMQV